MGFVHNRKITKQNPFLFEILNYYQLKLKNVKKELHELENVIITLNWTLRNLSKTRIRVNLCNSCLCNGLSVYF